MKRVELLIDMARKLSQNTRYDSTAGVQQDVFVQYLRNAQDSLYKNVVNTKAKYFKETVQVSIVSRQEVYPWPDRCFMQHVDTIQWVLNPNAASYFKTLNKSYTKEKISNQLGYPFAYIPFLDGFHLNPPVNNGFLYVTYIRTQDQLAKRAGQILSLTNTAGVLSALSVDPNEASYDETEINTQNYLCVVARDGYIKARNIPYNSCSAGVFNLSSYTLASTDVLAVGDYIVVGKNSVNLPDWPDICESYLIKYANYQAKYGDSSQWEEEAKDDMKAEFASLSGCFSALSDDVGEIPITNTDYLFTI